MASLEKTFDVAAIERKLAELWSQTTRGLETEDPAVLRARVANLMVFVPNDELLKEVTDSMQALTEIHPGRVLILLGDKSASDRDVETVVASLCHEDKRTGAKRLCGEEVTLTAQGKFVIELPSAALPLLVSDLSTFLWWRDKVETSSEVFRKLLAATDRLVIDSADLISLSELKSIQDLLVDETFRQVRFSDLNWARLTLWRSLLADFYDVPAYGSSLDQIESVVVDYVAAEAKTTAGASQAFLIIGWLASRLRWTMREPIGVKEPTIPLELIAPNNRKISIELNQTSRTGRTPGRLVQVQLRSTEGTSFVVTLSQDNRHVLSEVRLHSDVRRGRVLPVRNRSTSELLAREMEILSNDRVYQEAVAVAVQIFAQTTE